MNELPDLPLDAAAFVASAHAPESAESGELQGITELSREFGVSLRAIRFYEDKGLLTPRRINGGRAYTRRDRVRLSLILRAKAMGFALSEIEHFLELYGDHGEGRVKQLEFVVDRTGQAIKELESRRAHIDATLAELRVINTGVRNALQSKRRK